MVWLKRFIEGAGIETVSMYFAELRLYEKKSTSRVSGVTLSQANFSHLKSKRRVWNLTISADETITATKKTFLEEFWCSHGSWFFEGTNEPIESQWIEVVLPEGEMPREFLEGHRFLVEDTFTLTEKAGSL